MKNQLLKKRFLFKAMILLPALALLASGCAKANDKTPNLTPKYILNGSYIGTEDIFDYYDIGNGEYAVSLNDTVKKTRTQAIQVPATYTINETEYPVTGIWHNAFHATPAASITLTNNIKTIDFEAFLYSGITRIVIPYSVSEIGDAAFYSCNNLTTVTFVNSDQESSGSARDCYCDENGDPIGGGQVSQEIHYSGLTTIPSHCFFKCSAMTTLSLPASIQEICEDAFNGCYLLNSPIYFSSIKKIRARAFQGCAELRKVYISSSLFTDEVGIEPHAFNYCSLQESPENLDIVFCGDSTTVNNWVSTHPNWGWYNDRADPSGNKYTARIETGSTLFSADWDYTCDPNGDVTITKYNGPVPNAQTGYFISVPDHMPTPANNRVIRISRNAFNEATRLALRRLYLPKTMVAIENNMFNIWQANGNHVDKPGSGHLNYNNAHGYANLTVVDDNTKCVIDKGLFDTGHEAEIPKRIDLSGLTDLEFIGFRAFSGIGGSTNNALIKKLRLPAKIRAIGDEAFGIFSQRMLPSIDEFTWDFDENDSILETIGTDCFYGLGQGGSGQIDKNLTWKEHTPTTIIFPKTFKYFSILGSDKKRYKEKQTHPFDFESYKPEKYQRPSHAFAGCSLLGKVIFKGGTVNETTDLVIPLQTFVFNESLKTIVFEEREGHEITFHTQQSGQNFAQEAIGGNSGRGENDFRGEPFLQTLVLPNKNTKLRFQSFCFHANSRATIYLSGTLGTNMVSDASGGDWAWITSNGTSSNNGTVATFQNNPYENAVQWKTIGDESRFENRNNQKYYGYVFSSVNTGDHSSDKSIGTYDINQEIPVYQNVHYKEVIDYKNTPSVTSDDITVEVGKNNAFEYYEDGLNSNYCSFVCGTVGDKKVATMTNYMYSLHDDKDSPHKLTARVPETVTVNGTTYTVNKIGDSAFSACYCDGKYRNKSVGSFDDLRAIELPNTIISIGDYAFTRAYGVTKISSYSTDVADGAASEGMPSSLIHIGKSAFLFSSVKKVLKIPNACRFYETYPVYPTGVVDDAENPGNPTITTPSLFSAANDLRRISFLKNGNEVDSSDYYETTTYTSKTSGTPKYTCALYSKENNNLTYNQNRLLLVLNRDNTDAKQPSANNADCETVTRSNSVVGLRFNGLYKTNTYLYGAFKMGYWILDLKLGNPVINPSTSKPYPQPIISGVGTRGSNNSTLKTNIIYLGKASYTYEGLKCDLDTISGNVLNLPQYAMNGCEKLANVEMPIQQDGVLPEGVFAGVTDSNTTYYVEGDTPVAHTLDLTNSQYIEIGPNVFRENTSIQTFIAPDVNSFTIGSGAFADSTGLVTLDFTEVNTTLSIGSSAFASCTNITSVDFGDISNNITINSSAFNGCSKLSTISFGNVTGSITIKESAFASCGNSDITLDFGSVTGTVDIQSYAFNGSKVANIIWPTAPGSKVKIGNAAFNNCDRLTSVVIPSNLDGSIGGSAFKDCDNVTTVTLPSNLSGDKIGGSAFQSCDKLTSVVVDGNSIALTAIGSSAFKDCPLLSNFEFDKFISLTQIKSSAFENSGTLTSTGDVVLPVAVTSLGESAFKASQIVTITIQSGSISLGATCFENCTSLEAVRFTNHACIWNSYNIGVFNGCTSLEELQLPSTFNLNIQNTYDPNASLYFIQNDSAVYLYSYHKYSSSVQASPEWRTVQNGSNEKPVIFFVETLSDLTDSGVVANPGSVLVTDVEFWTVDANGVAIYLGTVTSYNGTIVTFSSGYTLGSSGFNF